MSYGDSVNRPFIHLVDGGVLDNVGMRGVLEAYDEVLFGGATFDDLARRDGPYVITTAMRRRCTRSS
jgi:NTE family protein